MRKLYTRSPIFVQSSTGTDAEVGIRIWQGNTSAVPSTNTYTLNKTHNSNGKATFEVSDLLSDYIEHSFSGTYESRPVYVRFYVIETGGSTYNSETLLALDGYTEGDTVQYITQSEYNIASDEILMTVGTLATPEDTTTVVPTQNADSVLFFKDNVLKFTQKLSDTNFFSQPNTFADWTRTSTTSVTDGTIAPDGVSEANFITQSGSGAKLRRTIVAQALGTKRTVTAYVKYVNLQYFYIRAIECQNGFTPANGNVIFDLVNKSINYVGTDIDSANISEYGDYLKVEVNYSVRTSSGSGTDLMDFFLSPNNSGSSTSSGTGSGYIWGSKLENNSDDTQLEGYSAYEIEYATSTGQSASTFYARVIADGGTIVDEHCSDDIMEYVTELDVDKIHVVKSDGFVEVIEVEQLPCNKYENSKLTFVNKFGVLQNIHFSAKNSKSYKFKGEEYKSLSFDYDNLSNNYGQHSKTSFNKNGETMHKLNTDYLPESYSEYFKELLMSERVWMEHKGTVVPVSVSKSSLEHKTHINNGLIQFDVTVTESHNIATNIR